MRLMTKEWLISLKSRALRKHVWYRALRKIERSLVELTIRCVDRIKSEKLALAISRIACKVFKRVRTGFLGRVERKGHRLAEKLSELAVGWGYLEAYAWRKEPSFIRYLGVNSVNNPTGWSHV